MNCTFRPEITFRALVGIIVTELKICDYEILNRLERFTKIIPLQDLASFNRGISLWIKVLETNILVNVLEHFLYKMEMGRETKGNTKGQGRQRLLKRNSCLEKFSKTKLKRHNSPFSPPVVN